MANKEVCSFLAPNGVAVRRETAEEQKVIQDSCESGTVENDTRQAATDGAVMKVSPQTHTNFHIQVPVKSGKDPFG